MLDHLMHLKLPNPIQVLGFIGLYALFRMLLGFTEWLRVHYLLNTKVPKGPPAESVVSGNLCQCVRPDFHRVHEEWTNAHGGIFSWRV